MIPTGPIEVALRTGATVIPSFCVRTEQGGVDAYLEEPLRLERTGDMDRDVRTNTLRFLARLERRLRDHPDQWVVLESIWDGVPASSERPPAAVEGKA
jgi:lauroyl/myristoyl acyltransferase